MKNMNNGERIVRVAIGAVVIGWGIFARSWWGAIGLLPLLTGLIGWCGLCDDKSKSCGCGGGKRD